MKLTSFRVFVLLCAACGLMLAAAFGLTYGANKLFTTQAGTLDDAKVDHAVAEDRETALATAQANIKKYETLNEIAQGVIPQDKDQARTVGEIVAIANRNNINIGGITFPASRLGNTSRSKATSNAESQLTPVKGVSGLYVMQVAVTSSGLSRYDNFLRFINDLQSNRRTANITSVSAQPSSTNRNFVTFDLSINAYIRP